VRVVEHDVGSSALCTQTRRSGSKLSTSYSTIL